MKKEIRARSYWIVEAALVGVALTLAYLMGREDADRRRAPAARGRRWAEEDENPYYLDGGHLRADSNFRALIGFFGLLFLAPIGMALWVIATTHHENYGGALEEQIGAIWPLMMSGASDGWGMIALVAWTVFGILPGVFSAVTNRLWNIAMRVLPVWFISGFAAAFVWLGYLAYKGIWRGEL